MNKENLTVGSKPLHTGSECESVFCHACGRALPAERDRIGRKDEKCICPDCYREIVAPYGGKRHDSHCL